MQAGRQREKKTLQHNCGESSEKVFLSFVGLVEAKWKVISDEIREKRKVTVFWRSADFTSRSVLRYDRRALSGFALEQRPLCCNARCRKMESSIGNRRNYVNCQYCHTHKALNLIWVNYLEISNSQHGRREAKKKGRRRKMSHRAA